MYNHVHMYAHTHRYLYGLLCIIMYSSARNMRKWTVGTVANPMAILPHSMCGS